MIEIRSYRRVFDLERRIYRIDRLRLNPGGVPVRGLVYLLALTALGALVERLPLLGPLADMLPWYLRELIGPAAAATLLCLIGVEGRPFHLAVWALARYAAAPRRTRGLRRCPRAGSRWRPGEVLFLPDGSEPRVRALRYTGPGAVLVCVEHERIGRGWEGGRRWGFGLGFAAKLLVREARGGGRLPTGKVVLLRAGARLVVRPRAGATDGSGE
jgi:hypothetical protein